MIKVIYGAKGTGKTKMMIDAANAAIADAKGHMIFITDTNRDHLDQIMQKIEGEYKVFSVEDGMIHERKGEEA